jgi:hypothetical protein
MRRPHRAGYRPDRNAGETAEGAGETTASDGKRARIERNIAKTTERLNRFGC